MKEVKKCSISSVAFTLDGDAYDALYKYLETLKKSYSDTSDGAEIVADIEARIAELILSHQEASRVVELSLIVNIIDQMGSAEDINESISDNHDSSDEPRIPRRLYRDMDGAKLGGVCSGIAKYFDTDPVWIRLGLFVPIIFSCLGWIPVPFLGWMSSIMGNLFGVFVICYLVMWFAVPVARTARQRLEMNGEKITVQSIKDSTANNNAPDNVAKPVVANVISAFGQIVLVCLKIILGFMIFVLILTACALVIGILAISVGGVGVLSIAMPTIWVPILGIFVALIPVIMLIYIFMCLIASRKPGGKAILAIFLLWLAMIIACTSVAIHENTVRNVIDEYGGADNLERIIKGHQNVVVNIDDLEDSIDDQINIKASGDNDTASLRITVPNKSIDIKIDKNTASIKVDDSGVER